MKDDDRRGVMPDCIIDVRTSINFSDQLLFIITGDTQSNKDYLSTFDASVDNVDIVTYNNL